MLLILALIGLTVKWLKAWHLFIVSILLSLSLDLFSDRFKIDVAISDINQAIAGHGT